MTANPLLKHHLIQVCLKCDVHYLVIKYSFVNFVNYSQSDFKQLFLQVPSCCLWSAISSFKILQVLELYKLPPNFVNLKEPLSREDSFHSRTQKHLYCNIIENWLAQRSLSGVVLYTDIDT